MRIGSSLWRIYVIDQDGNVDQGPIDLAAVNSMSASVYNELALSLDGKTAFSACSDYNGNIGKFAVLTGV